MEYIRIAKDSIDAEHTCCAMSGKQSVAKKEWLRQRFDDGLVFYRSEERGKCFSRFLYLLCQEVPYTSDGFLLL